jgi:hypothetical protein
MPQPLTLVVRSADRDGASVSSTDMHVPLQQSFQPSAYTRVLLVGLTMPFNRFSFPSGTINTLRGATPGSCTFVGGYYTLAGAAAVMTTALATNTDGGAAGGGCTYSSATNTFTIDWVGAVVAQFDTSIAAANNQTILSWFGFSGAQVQGTTVVSNIAPGQELLDREVMINIPTFGVGAAKTTGGVTTATFALTRNVARGIIWNQSWPSSEAPLSYIDETLTAFITAIDVSVHLSTGGAFVFDQLTDWSFTLRLE